MEIQGYENYLIYEDGRVYSKYKKDFRKAHTTKQGYYRIGIYNKGKCKHLYIHRLIALHYIPNPENYEEVDHIDRNPLNNSISNLRWANRKIQLENQGCFSNTGEKYIHKTKGGYCYEIAKTNCFRELLKCKDYTLEDAINLRDALLSIEDNIV